MKIITIGIMIFCLNISSIVLAQSSPNPPPPPPNCRSVIDYNYYAIITILADDDVPCGHNNPPGDSPLGAGSMLLFDELVNGMSFDTHLTIMPRSMVLRNGSNNPSAFKFMEVVNDSAVVILSANITYSKVDGYALVVDAQDVNGEKSISLNINQMYEVFDLKISWVNSGCVDRDLLCYIKNGQIVVEIDGIEDSIVGVIDDLYYMGSNNGDQRWKASAVYWGVLESQNFNSDVNFVDPGY